MEDGRRVQANTDGHLQLPKEIIQHIQHFLTAKEAAQTTVLSKCWFNSWLTRSTLDFDEHHFCMPGSQIGEEFVPFVNRIISREVDFSSLSSQRKPKIVTRFHDMTPGSAVGRRIFKTLTDLVLAYVKIDPVMQMDFSVIFPCIKKLTIRNCRSCKVLGITSKSLEVITCEGMFTVAKLNIPCMNFFKFKGANIPILTFTQCSKKWESEISLTSWHPCDSWFRDLQSFLSELSESKISLNLSIIGTVIDLVGDLQLQSSPKPAVENLRLVYNTEIVSTEVCSMIWDNLLWSFSPKFINYKQHPKSNNVCGKEKYEEFWEDFTRRMLDQHFIGTAEGLLLIRGLDGVDLELFEHPRAEWQPLPWETFFDDSTIPAAGLNVRFRLRWKPCANAGAHCR